MFGEKLIIQETSSEIYIYQFHKIEKYVSIGVFMAFICNCNDKSQFKVIKILVN